MRWWKLAAAGALALTAIAATLIVRGTGSTRGETPQKRTAAAGMQSSSTTTAMNSEASLRIDLSTAIGLPAEGIAVEQGQRVTFIRLDGTVLGWTDATLRGGDAPGPVVVGTDPRTNEGFVLDPSAGRFVKVKDAYGRWPLAYGAEMVTDPDITPGRSWVERRGRKLFDLGLNTPPNTNTVSNDRDIVSATLYRDSEFDNPRARPVSHKAIDLRSGRTVALPRGCDVGDRHATRWYLLCGEPNDWRRTTIDLLANGRRSMIVEPLAKSGHWVTVAASPDGTRLMAQWSGECEIPSVLIVDVHGVTVPTPFEPKAAEAVGWSKDGRAIVSLSESGCGESWDQPGIYAFDGNGLALIYAFPKVGDDEPGVGSTRLWSSTLT